MAILRDLFSNEEAREVSNVKLKIKGTTYGGAPAGSGGDEIEASLQAWGQYKREIWYRVVAHETLMETLSRIFSKKWHVQSAYVTDADYRSLEELSVTLDRSGATESALATYALYGSQ